MNDSPTDTEFEADARGSLREAMGEPQKAVRYFSAYGWRGRIGLVSPSTNSTLEPEFNLMAPEGVSVHAARVMQLGKQDDRSYRVMADGIARASRELSTVEVDAAAFGCTSCTYFVPAQEITENIERNAGCPGIVTADAVLSALRTLGAKRVALGTPRTQYVTDREVKFLEENGFEVVSVLGMGIGATEAERRAIGRVPLESIVRMAHRIDRPEADAIFISCTQLPTVTVIAEIEDMLGKPVVTSNQATFWSCLRLMGLNTPVAGFGTLLEQH